MTSQFNMSQTTLPDTPDDTWESDETLSGSMQVEHTFVSATADCDVDFIQNEDGDWANCNFKRDAVIHIDWNNQELQLVCQCQNCNLLPLNQAVKRVVYYLCNSDGSTYITTRSIKMYNKKE